MRYEGIGIREELCSDRGSNPFRSASERNRRDERSVHDGFEPRESRAANEVSEHVFPWFKSLPARFAANELVSDSSSTRMDLNDGTSEQTRAKFVKFLPAGVSGVVDDG